MKTHMLSLALLLGAAYGFGQQVKGITGWVEDGVAHTPGNSAETVKQAIAGGAPFVFVDDKDKIIWRVDNPQVLKGHEGQHISFTGTMVANVNTVHVDHLTVLKNQTPGAKADAIGRK